jgi:hypothetical protein
MPRLISNLLLLHDLRIDLIGTVLALPQSEMRGNAMKEGFGKYVASKREQAVDKLLHKAYIANRLAKISHGRSRAVLYGIKYKHLSQAVAITGTKTYCDSVIELPIQLFGISTARGYRFHVPAGRLTPIAMQRLESPDSRGLDAITAA